MVSALYQIMDWNRMSTAFPLRERNAHKGDFGHVLMIGGDYGMGGAVRMSAEAALRVGAGLVTVATRAAHVSLVSGIRPEIMCYSVDSDVELLPLLRKATVIVIGPGLGQTDWAKTLLQCALSVSKPILIDADALNLWSQLSLKRSQLIMTPHPGEAAGLLGISITEVQKDRYAAAKNCVTQYGGICVLKGAGTIVHADHHLPMICHAGNPGMASAGMGDVLSGVIGGLWAQKLTDFEAATIGVMVHAMAGDLAAKSGGERGLIATDLMKYIRRLVNPK